MNNQTLIKKIKNCSSIKELDQYHHLVIDSRDAIVLDKWQSQHWTIQNAPILNIRIIELRKAWNEWHKSDTQFPSDQLLSAINNIIN